MKVTPIDSKQERTLRLYIWLRKESDSFDIRVLFLEFLHLFFKVAVGKVVNRGWRIQEHG